MIAISQPQWAISRGLIHRRDLKFEARMWLDLVCSWLMPSPNTIEVPIEISIIVACIMDNADNVITLATKTDKDAPSMKREKCTTRRTPPLPSASSTTLITQSHPAAIPTPTPPNLLKIAQRA
ncbi:hypothetical protein HAX54_015000 [Datura stramonium]|uniref:Uncharacterized protein n=1 Tax=Datura stramonium TaxID=4076 RepID=A0ABS8TQX0_DATST|nr:hypothetical protein [Datura stramonium]